MNLDEELIMETAEKVKKGIVHKEKLKELLGGERLDYIFDSKTQEAIFDNIINNGKLHNMISAGNGLDILDGLLNNQVNSNLSDFYMIKPDYILQLPLDQQRNMANSISGNRQDLSSALQNLWRKGIRTEACTTKSSDNIPMLQLNIKESEIEKQEIVQQLYEQNGINGNAFYDYQSKEFHINLSGNDLYNYLQQDNIPLSQTRKSNIFEDAIKDSLQFAEEMYTSYSQNGMDTTELRREILSERTSLEEFGNRLKQKAEKEQQQNILQDEKTDKKLPVKQSRLSRIFNKIRSRFIRYKTQEYQEQSGYAQTSKTQTQGKKSWELKPEEKARIQRKTAKIAQKYQKQQEQNQELHHSQVNEK